MQEYLTQDRDILRKIGFINAIIPIVDSYFLSDIPLQFSRLKRQVFFFFLICLFKIIHFILNLL